MESNKLISIVTNSLVYKEKNKNYNNIKSFLNFNDSEINEYLTLLHNLISDFQNTFSRDCEIFILRVPGRVNLIGEHLDYNGFPVLPIAIEKNIIFIISPRDDNKVYLQSYMSQLGKREFSLSKSEIPFKTGDWGNYVKAGTLGLNLPNLDKLKGFNALVYGNIPIASGLSSSSAMVVASALSLMKINGLEFDKLELADKLSKAEHYVGTIGGGMDQAAILFGEENRALKIDFFPLKIQPVKIPEGYNFIVVNSCIQAAKTEKMKNEYNRRPIECKIAAGLFNKYFSDNLKQHFNIEKLSDIYKAGISDNDIEKTIKMFFIKESFSNSELAAKLNITRKDFLKKYLTLKNGEVFTEPNNGFKLLSRVKYIFNENKRVLDSLHCFETGNMEKFGQNMNEAHKEARDLYEISTPELDLITDIAIENGASGARLTGAGFGGCCIILSKINFTNSVIKNLKEKYFKIYLRDKYPDIFKSIKSLEDQVFICSPSSGAKFLFE